MGEVVQEGHEAHDHVQARRAGEHDHVKTLVLDDLPVLEELRPRRAEEAEDGAAGPDADDVRHEHARNDGAKDTGREVHESDLPRAVAVLELHAEASEAEHVDHDVDDAAVHEHGRDEPPPLAVLDHEVVLLGAAVQQGLRAGADDGVVHEGLKLPVVHGHGADEVDDARHHDEVDEVHGMLLMDLVHAEAAGSHAVAALGAFPELL
mmetsp:Transcript_23076/g.71880  ORF Transcript_23076/g.71880 Transcript_23076/m.71880 type:complete len:207 (+) Transcript_23076:882-1502(+)